MDIKDVLAVSGLPGLFKLVNTRNNGLFVRNVEGGKTKFCSTRTHNFTPLETVAIYTIEDTVELKTVLESMRTSETVVPGHKDNKEAITGYFSEVLPDYDPDRVHLNDMKKIIKWYNTLDKTGLLDAEEQVSSDEEE